MTAPTGTSSSSRHSIANSKALSMKSLSLDENISSGSDNESLDTNGSSEDELEEDKYVY